MPSTNCPKCGRQLEIDFEQLSQDVICPHCRGGFSPTGDDWQHHSEAPAVRPTPPRPLPPARPELPRALSPEPYESGGEMIWDPARRSKAPLIALLISIAAVVALIVSIVAIAASRSDSHQAAKAGPARTETAQGSGYDPTEAAQTTFLLGLGLFIWGMICIGSIVYMAVVVLLLAWVVKDARARGSDGAIWVIVILLSGVVGFLVYLASRPYGALVICPHCMNKRLLAALTCPHCGRSA